ncbi:hypothetical protein ACJJTC_011059 [Scirpophaga incertulas]
MALVRLFRLTVICASALGSLQLRPSGWLDRLVDYHKQKFLQDVQDTQSVEIKVSIIPRPHGYVDSPNWDVASARRLWRAVGHQIRTRRFLSRQDSFKYFPSIGKGLPNYMYYDIGTADYGEPDISTDILFDDDVLIVSNPTEARLPSSKISVKLLRQILEARAEAGRVMPPTTKVTIKWRKGSTTASTASNDQGNMTTDGTNSDNGTTTEDADGVDTTNKNDTDSKNDDTKNGKEKAADNNKEGKDADGTADGDKTPEDGDGNKEDGDATKRMLLRHKKIKRRNMKQIVSNKNIKG